MPPCVAVPHETVPGERRVALVPSVAEQLTSQGHKVCIEAGAGAAAFYRDSEYATAQMIGDRAALFGAADILLTVQPLDREAIGQLREGATVIGFLHPHENPQRIALLRDHNITSFAMELIPRLSRAQSMDALSSHSSIAGYKCALMAATRTARFFPMLTTAAGTIRPAKVLVIGVGVAGLQAIATAKRLGAMVEAYDVRPETREQVESLGAKFVDVHVRAEGSGGYARELTEEEKQREVDVLQEHVIQADAIIATAAVPGKPAPCIISAAMVDEMKHGAVIIDLAAESGGNCELTVPGEAFGHERVMIYGPLNVPAMLPVHASEMYAKNLYNFLSLIVRDGELNPDWDDEIVVASALTHAGEILHEPSRELVEAAS
ncbi:MAG: Re/Si-specific NAD(P)(+) transhydrogenase subunit alpha [Gammaproteobacteria bacterium]|nr:MAG: Re/Si-specific NAD(P)(+) transhydrogenase subunit alpha [Gammaproteobacteria bacterium]